MRGPGTDSRLKATHGGHDEHLSIICTEFGLICRDGIGAKKALMRAILGPLLYPGLVLRAGTGDSRGR